MEDRMHIECVRKEDGSIDYMYAAVYDGHGGAQASEYAREHLLENIRVDFGMQSICGILGPKGIRLRFRWRSSKGHQERVPQDARFDAESLWRMAKNRLRVSEFQGLNKEI